MYEHPLKPKGYFHFYVHAILGHAKCLHQNKNILGLECKTNYMCTIFLYKATSGPVEDRCQVVEVPRVIL